MCVCVTIFVFVCVGACVCVYAESKESIQSLGTGTGTIGVCGVSGLLNGCWDLNSSLHDGAANVLNHWAKSSAP